MEPHHTWSNLNDRLRARVRAAVAKRSRPTAAVLDSQTVRSDPHGGTVGYDAAQKTKGRKSCILVDTLGLLLGATVVAASTPERAGAQTLLAPLLPVFSWLRRLWVDGGFSGPDCADWVRTRRRKLKVEILKRPVEASGFAVLPRRWVVERTFAWLVRDYERTETSATAWIFVAMIRIMLRRLA